MALRRAGILLGLLGTLAGCAAIRESRPELAIVADALRTRIGETPGAAAPADPPTRAEVAGFTAPLLYARIPARGTDALFALAGTNGAARTWASENDITLTLKRGVLVATRGLGPDLIAAAVPDPARAGTGPYTRRYRYLDGNDQLVTRTFRCRLADAGAGRVVVLERGYPARRVNETCRGADGRMVENAYWVDGSGVIRQSRQWVGPRVGYITLQQVVA